jgi:steroid delta-isomerase-like uncharacterized protein
MTTETSTLQANKALVRQAILANHRDHDSADAIFVPGFLSHTAGQPAQNREGFEAQLAAFGAAFPGYTYEIHDQIAQGDMVANRVTWHAVHTGTFAGVPATGRTVEIHGINLFKLRDGRVVEQWAQPDFLGLMQQIGAIPTGH